MMSQETCLTHICVTTVLPGTCGELVQGTLDGVPCLVSCPIDRYSIAHIELCPDPNWSVPHDAPKTAAALRAGLIYLGQTSWGGRLELDSDLPRGRGYASSTADVAATLYALGEAVGRKLTDTEVARLAVVCGAQRQHDLPRSDVIRSPSRQLPRMVGDPPSAVVVVCDPGEKSIPCTSIVRITFMLCACWCPGIAKPSTCCGKACSWETCPRSEKLQRSVLRRTRWFCPVCY